VYRLTDIYTMKIKLYYDCIAVLQEESGQVVAALTSSDDARNKMEKAVRETYDCDCFLLTDKDFIQPFDYNETYKFKLYKEQSNGDDDETISLTLTYTTTY